MKKIDLFLFLRKVAFFQFSRFKYLAYTLAEVIIVMLIIAVIVAVTIGITKAKLDNVLSYTYYNGYSTLRDITTEMLSNWNPKDENYSQSLNQGVFFAQNRIESRLSSNILYLIPNIKKYISNLYVDTWQQPAYAACPEVFYTIDPTAVPDSFDTHQAHVFSCERAGGEWCDGMHTQETYGCFACCTSKYSCSPLLSKECAIHAKVPDYATCSCKPSCQFEAWEAYNKCVASGGSMDIDYPACKVCVCPSNKIEQNGECVTPPSCTSTSEGYNIYMNCVATGGTFASYPSCSCSCPSGYELKNKKCVLKSVCPSAEDMTCGYTCDPDVGIPTPIAGFSRTCSDETYEWSEEQCKCIPSPRTLPRKGENFCKLFEANANIMGNTDVCQGSMISSNTTDFSDKKPDITLRNGLRLYNMHNDATAIAMLEGNTQGGEYDGVPNTNAYGYTVYIDIDGAKGDSKLWSDVYPFYITLSGKVIPGYDHVANPNGAGGDSTSHLQVSVEYEHYNGGKRNISWLAKSVPFKDGACIAGYVGDATPYCRNTPSVSKSSSCTTDSDSVCRVKQIQPVKFFF